MIIESSTVVQFITIYDTVLLTLELIYDLSWI